MNIRWIYLEILLLFVLGSCGPSPSLIGDSTAPPPADVHMKKDPAQITSSLPSENQIRPINTPDYTGMPLRSDDTNRFVKLAEEDLAMQLNVSVDRISLLKITVIDWQDITLGCAPTSGQTLTKGNLSGYRIWLEVNDVDYVYHVGLDGKVFLCTNVYTP